jgi:hypothetical protein
VSSIVISVKAKIEGKVVLAGNSTEVTIDPSIPPSLAGFPVQVTLTSSSGTPNVVRTRQRVYAKPPSSRRSMVSLAWSRGSGPRGSQSTFVAICLFQGKQVLAGPIREKPCIKVNAGLVYNRKKVCPRPILSSISKGFILRSSMALIPTETISISTKGKSTESKYNKTAMDLITQILVEYHIHTTIILEYNSAELHNLLHRRFGGNKSSIHSEQLEDKIAKLEHRHETPQPSNSSELYSSTEPVPKTYQYDLYWPLPSL